MDSEFLNSLIGVPSTEKLEWNGENLINTTLKKKKRKIYSFKELYKNLNDVTNDDNYLHNTLWVPEDWIGVEIGSGVEPYVKLLLSIALALAEDIGVKNIRIATQIPQEFKVYLIMCWSLRRQLQHKPGKGKVSS